MIIDILRTLVPMASRASVALVTAVVVCIQVPTVVHADSVEKILGHGKYPPTSYGVFKDRLFFTRRGKLLRLDAVGERPVEVSLPRPLPYDDFISARFTTFDDHLIVSVGGRLFRFKEPDSDPVEIDTRVPVRPEHIPQDEQPHLTGASSFTQYKGVLYFMAHEPIWCGERTFATFIYRLRSAGEKVEYAGTQVSSCGAWSATLTATENALLIETFLAPGSRYVHIHEYTVVHVLPDPIGYPLSDLPPSQGPAPVTSCGSSKGLNTVLFDGDLYFGGLFSGREGMSNETGTVGPFDTLCDGPMYGGESWQREPVRFDIDTGKAEYFDLYQLSETERLYYNWWGGAPSRDETFGSSEPANFVIANDVLYFQAATRGSNQELFRKTTGCEVPQAIELNQNAPSKGFPIGEYLGRLWLFADTGSGNAIHYLDDDGLSAVPLSADIVILDDFRQVGPRDVPRGFVEFDGGVVFTATSTDGKSGTYIARIDRDPPPPPVNDEPCFQTQPADPPQRPAFTSSIGVNGKYSHLHRIDVGSSLAVACEAMLIYEAESVVRASILEHRPDSDGNRVLKTCTDNLQPFDSQKFCRVKVPARRGETRYFCRVTTRADDGRVVVKRATTRVIAERPRRID